MTAFPLRIVTPDGLKYDGQAEEVVVRATTGELGILAGHVPCVAPLGMGQAMFVMDGKKRYAACIGGMLSVVDGRVSIMATTFEWAQDIDAQRAVQSEYRARAVLQDKASSDTDVRLAEARLKRALIRKQVAERK